MACGEAEPYAVPAPRAAIELDDATDALQLDRRWPTTTTFTMEAWLRIDRAGFVAQSHHGDGERVALAVSPESINFVASGVLPGDGWVWPVPDDGWHHVAARAEPRRLSIFVDGRLEGEWSTVGAVRLVASPIVTLGAGYARTAGGGAAFEYPCFRGALARFRVTPGEMSGLERPDAWGPTRDGSMFDFTAPPERGGWVSEADGNVARPMGDLPGATAPRWTRY